MINNIQLPASRRGDLILSRDRLFLARDTVFFLPLVLCVRTPYQGVLGCQNRWYPQSIFRMGKSPLKVAPLQTENCSRFTLHEFFVQRITSHGHKKYKLIDYDRIKPKLCLNHLFWSLLIWPHPARFKICLVTWPHCDVIVTCLCHCGCLDTKWLSRHKQFKCIFKRSKLLAKNLQ